MKKNKKLQYTLMALVVLIWGTIIYKVVHYKGDGDTYYQAPTTGPIPVFAKIEKPVDSFDIIVSYRDPFTGKISKGGKSKSTSQKKEKRAGSTQLNQKPLPPPTPLPSLTYRGYILKNEQISSVRVDIDGEACSMRLKQSRKNIVLEEINMEFIVVSHHGEKHTVYREKF